MHWLFTNYQWLVAVVVMPIILLLLKQWVDSRKKTAIPAPAPAQQATQNVENSQVTNSPVAAGSGINQNVNAPVINLNVGQPIAPPAQPEPLRPAPVPRHLPNIIVTGAHIASVSQVDQGVWSESHPMQDAFVVQFTNEARRGGPNVRGLSSLNWFIVTVCENFAASSAVG